MLQAASMTDGTSGRGRPNTVFCPVALGAPPADFASWLGSHIWYCHICDDFILYFGAVLSGQKTCASTMIAMDRFWGTNGGSPYRRGGTAHVEDVQGVRS